jgi:signal peptidase II
MKIKYLILATISGAIITIDQASKMYILTHLRLGDVIEVIPRVFNITHVHNPGAAFGFLAQSQEAFRHLFFYAMPPVALLIILAILRGISEADRWTIAALSAVFGGAIGNYIDRLRFRYVVDFLDFTVVYDTTSVPEKRFVYPSFNVADMAIVCGVVVLIFLEFVKQKRKTSEEKTQTSHAT